MGLFKIYGYCSEINLNNLELDQENTFALECNSEIYLKSVGLEDKYNDVNIQILLDRDLNRRNYTCNGCATEDESNDCRPIDVTTTFKVRGIYQSIKWASIVEIFNDDKRHICFGKSNDGQLDTNTSIDNSIRYIHK